MAIASLDDYIGSVKQNCNWYATATRTTVANIWFTLFDVVGAPRGVLAAGNTANGLVHTDATAGYPPIAAFAGGAKGYLSRIEAGNTVAGRIALYDRLFVAGAYAFNANTTLASQPSYVSRLPDGVYANNTEIWIEAVTAFTGNQSIRVLYTNQDGTAGRDTGTIATGVAPTIGRMLQLPLQQGDTGVQKIEQVISTVSSVGTFNVMVLRPLWAGRIYAANWAECHDMLRTGLPEVFADSAILPIFALDGTSSGLPDLRWEVASK